MYVAQQLNLLGAVWIVFDPLHARRDAFLVALEVDDSVMLLVATADVAGGDPAVVVAATGPALLLEQGRMRRTLVQVGRDHAHRAAAAGGSRSEEHTSELKSLMRISYAGFCLKKKKN